MNERIRQLRSALKLSQSEFGAKINLSQNYIWMIEKGERAPSNRTISDICREFGVSLAWLETGEGEMYVQRSENERLALMFADVLAEATNPPASAASLRQWKCPLSSGTTSTSTRKKSPEANDRFR